MDKPREKIFSYYSLRIIYNLFLRPKRKRFT